MSSVTLPTPTVDTAAPAFAQAADATRATSSIQPQTPAPLDQATARLQLAQVSVLLAILAIISTTASAFKDQLIVVLFTLQVRAKLAVQATCQ